MAFEGIQFADDNSNNNDNEIGIVNTLWFTLTKKEVYWPPVKSQDKYEKLLKRGEIPNNQWTLCQISRIFFETGEQYYFNT